jgi:hypothetical protein
MEKVMTDTTPAPAAATPETTATAAPAETVQSAEQVKVPQQASEPAGKDEQQANPESEKEQADAKEKRKAYSQERWRAKNKEIADSRRREQFLLGEVERLTRQQQQTDYSKITDPDEVLAAKTANHFRQTQVDEHKSRLQHEAQQRQTAVRDAWTAMADDMRTKAPDFDQVFNQNIPVHQHAVPFIVESEKGGEIAYWLGKNPDVARDLYSKFETAPAQALIELGRIEARLSAPPPKQISTAPKPAPVLSGGVNPVVFDAHTASVADVAAHLKKAGVIR